VFPDVRSDDAYALLATALQRGEGWLGTDDVWALLACYGVPTVQQLQADDPEATAHVAASFGGPVALKVMGPLHKTDVGAVRLGVPPEEVPQAAKEMLGQIGTAWTEDSRFVVQPMIEDAAEILVGAIADPQFGPVVACGAGGTDVELINDVQVGLVPLDRGDATRMVRGLTTFPLLDGFRGRTKKDVDSLIDVILRIGAMVDAHPAIVELDCNPVMVTPNGAFVVDARMRVREPTLHAPSAGLPG
jgi:acyl-CoA synthetase (NDP forming)